MTIPVRLGRAPLVGAITVSAMLAVSFALPSIAEMQSPGSKPPAAPSTEVPAGLHPAALKSFPRPNIPQLSEDEKAKALAIASGDPRVQPVLSKHEHQIRSIGVWHTRGLEKLGAGIVFSLAQPASIEMDWPNLIYDQAELTVPPYRQVIQRATAHNVQSLVVMVDLQRGAVAQITTGPGSQLVFPPGQEPTPSRRPE